MQTCWQSVRYHRFKSWKSRQSAVMARVSCGRPHISPAVANVELGAKIFYRNEFTSLTAVTYLREDNHFCLSNIYKKLHNIEISLTAIPKLHKHESLTNDNDVLLKMFSNYCFKGNAMFTWRGIAAVLSTVTQKNR